jgi:hypothetical protein
MNVVDRTLKNWTDNYKQPPKLNQNQRVATNALVIVFLVMAILQLASFNDFKMALSDMGVHSGTAAWAYGVIVAEVVAAIGLLGVKMNGIVRGLGRVAAVLASGFWFLLTLQAVTSMDENSVAIANTGYFGKYMIQAPGWWTVIEVTALMLGTIYALEVSKKK